MFFFPKGMMGKPGKDGRPGELGESVRFAYLMFTGF